MGLVASPIAEEVPLDLQAFARVGLCHQPTPIESMTRLSAHLGGPNLYIKRDDCTGLATGGNKTRKLDFLIGEALMRQNDVTGATREILSSPWAPQAM